MKRTRRQRKKDKERKGAKKERPYTGSAARQRLPEYHHLLFAGLESETFELIASATLEPEQARHAYWSSPDRVGAWLGEVAWQHLQEYLGQIEQRIRAIVEGHTVYYWIHLYRRIGVGLHRLLDDKPDTQTIALVRNILEVAFVRYGVLDDSFDDMGLTSEIEFDEIAGGLLVKQWEKALAPNQERTQSTLEFLRKAYRAGRQWVLKNFNAGDLVDIYRLEALAYEYWLTTARMRRVGKGGIITVSADGDIESAENSDLEKLLRSYDARIEKSRFNASSTGVAFYSRPRRDHVLGLLASYNVDKMAWSKIALADEVRVWAPELVTNFLLAPFSLSAFTAAHSFAAEAFRSERGFTLESLCGYLSATAAWVASMTEGSTDPAVRFEMWKELYQRAYIINAAESLEATLTQLAIEIMDEWLGAGAHRMATEAPLVHEFLTLRHKKRNRSGLWSLGPRYLFVPHRNGTVIDLESLLTILSNLFVGIRYGQGEKGVAFENEFRKYVTDSKLELLSERLLKNDGGERECDAVIQCATTLFVCECRAMGRPLDFEIGRISTLDTRRNDLQEKVVQALSCAEFIRQRPKGSNYDFSWATEVVPIVVSPFVEWIWAQGPELWIDDNSPRILSAEEAVDLMRKRASQ